MASVNGVERFVASDSTAWVSASRLDQTACLGGRERRRFGSRMADGGVGEIAPDGHLAPFFLVCNNEGGRDFAPRACGGRDADNCHGGRFIFPHSLVVRDLSAVCGEHGNRLSCAKRTPAAQNNDPVAPFGLAKLFPPH